MTDRAIRVATLIHGQPEYTDLLDQIYRDAGLVAAMWEDAESRPEELDLPGTWWSVVRIAGVPAAWCAARVKHIDGVPRLACHSNYERPGYRDRGLYELAYRERHRTVILPLGLPAVTYLFAQPIKMHEGDRWYETGVTGTSREADEPHQWWELRREVDTAATAGSPQLSSAR